MIFSGKNSIDLWKEICEVEKKRKKKGLALAVFECLYSFGCRCQELETEVEKLKKEVEKLQERKK